MIYPNNTKIQLFYYLPSSKQYGVLFFGNQLETNSDIVWFDKYEAWVNHINGIFGNNTWLNDMKAIIEPLIIPSSNVDYITEYNFRLAMNNDTENYLQTLINEHKNPTAIKAVSGDEIVIDYDTLTKIVNKYLSDKPLFLQIQKELQDLASSPKRPIDLPPPPPPSYPVA